MFSSTGSRSSRRSDAVSTGYKHIEGGRQRLAYPSKHQETTLPNISISTFKCFCSKFKCSRFQDSKIPKFKISKTRNSKLAQFKIPKFKMSNFQPYKQQHYKYQQSEIMNSKIKKNPNSQIPKYGSGIEIRILQAVKAVKAAIAKM